jgi:threonine/homoserine/homoserine lactone efflux protein
MTFEYLMKGMVLGISVAAPVGPIGVLCIKRTLTEGRTSGLVTGMGAAVADTLYGAIAAFGLTFVIDFLHEQQTIVGLIGGLLMLFMGLRLWKSKPPVDVEMEKGNLWHHFGSTILLTASNPGTIMFFIPAFAAFGIQTGTGNVGLSSIIVFGVFVGAAIWWLSLSYFVSIWKHKIKLSNLSVLNRIASVLVMIFGVYILIHSTIRWMG